MYDVTQFLDDHPGGDEVLITSTGKLLCTRVIFSMYSDGVEHELLNVIGLLQEKMQLMTLKMWATVILQKK